MRAKAVTAQVNFTLEFIDCPANAKICWRDEQGDLQVLCEEGFGQVLGAGRCKSR